MDSKSLLFAQLYVIAVVALLHIVGTWLSLYWVFWWYDILVHFLASIWVAFATTWIAQHLELKHTMLWVFCAVFLVSVGWEFFEYIIGATDRNTMYLDTAVDISMNMLGAGVGIVFTRRGQ